MTSGLQVGSSIGTIPLVSARTGSWISQVFEAFEQVAPRHGMTDHELFAAVRERVFAAVTLALSLLGRYCPERAEDITQDVLLKLLKLETKNGHDPKRGSLRAWLFGVVRWTVISAIRKEWNSHPNSEDILGAMVDKAPAPDVRAEQTELSQLVAVWVSELSDKCRLAVKQKYDSGKDHPTVTAQSTGRDYVNRSRGLAELKRRASELT